MDEKIKFPL